MKDLLAITKDLGFLLVMILAPLGVLLSLGGIAVAYALKTGLKRYLLLVPLLTLVLGGLEIIVLNHLSKTSAAGEAFGIGAVLICLAVSIGFALINLGLLVPAVIGLSRKAK